MAIHKHLLSLYGAVVLFSLSLPPTLCHAASSCAKLIPPGGAYDILRTSSNENLHDFLDEYTYQKNYGTHDEALADGFSLGAIVYGVPLQAGGTFDAQQKKTWFEEYKSRRTREFSSSKKATLESLKLNKEVIDIISRCIVSTEGFGIIAELDQTGDCTATFSAWYRGTRDNEPPLKTAKPALSVQGGTCEPWPKDIIGISPTVVNCRRSGRDGLIVTIATQDGPGKSDHLNPLPALGPKPEGHDKFADTYTKPATKPVVLYHKDFNFWNAPGTDLGDYRMTVYADITSPSGGPMVSADLVSCTGCGAHFWLCPDNGICPHPLFEPVTFGGIFFGNFITIGSSLKDYKMRVWAYRNSDQPPIELKINVHYFEKENTCVADCGKDLERAKWEAENSRTCSTIPEATRAPVGLR